MIVIAMMTAASSQPAAIHKPPNTIPVLRKARDIAIFPVNRTMRQSAYKVATTAMLWFRPQA